MVEKCGKTVLVRTCYSFVHLDPIVRALVLHPRVIKRVPLDGPTYCECVVICCRAPVAAARHPCVLSHLLCSLRGTRIMVPATAEPFTNTRLPLSRTPHPDSTAHSRYVEAYCLQHTFFTEHILACHSCQSHVYMERYIYI